MSFHYDAHQPAALAPNTTAGVPWNCNVRPQVAAAGTSAHGCKALQCRVLTTARQPHNATLQPLLLMQSPQQQLEACRL